MLTSRATNTNSSKIPRNFPIDARSLTNFQRTRSCVRCLVQVRLLEVLRTQRSLVYNVGAVAAAAAGLVNPLVAAVLMPLSSGLVLWGASRVEAAVRRGEAA